MRIGLVFLLISFSNLVFSQSLEWVGSYQSPLWQQPGGLVLGSDGYVYVSGRFKDDIDMDFGPSSYILNYTGTNVGPDFFVAKYDTLGNLVWARKFGGDIQTTNENELTIGVDGQNNVFICGKYSGFVDFDPGPGLDTIWTPGSNIFFSKYDSNGNYQWTKVINEGQFINDDYPNDMAIDIMGNIIITGAMGSNVDFDPSPTGQFNFPSYSSVDGFVAKYDNNGNFIWAKQLGGKNEGTALATDNTGNIFVGCYFKDSADVDPGLGTMYYTSLGSRDAAVLKLDQNGDFVWCNQIGSPYPSTYGDRINAMTTDSYGNVYAVGFFESTIDFDPGSNVFTVSSFDPDRDFFIVKYDSNGGFVLAEGVGNGGTDQVLDIFVDIQSNIYLVGDFAGVLDLDPSSNVNTVSTTLFRSLYFAMYDPYFNYLHSFSISTGCVTEATIDVDVAGKVYVIGGFEDLVDFDPDSSSDFFMSTSSAINENLFIGKYSFGQCNLFSGILNEALSLDCAQPGLISVTPVGGIAPFQYSWNTIPIVSDSLLQVNSGGFYSVSITDSTGCEIEKVILVDGPTGLNFDLDVNVIASTFRPGVNSGITIDVGNAGCNPTNGQVIFILDPSVTFVSGNPFPDQISGDSLIWNFTNLDYDGGHLIYSISVVSDTSLQGGHPLVFDAIVTPIINDDYPNNNIRNYNYFVSNGYDPNRKDVYPIGECDDHFVLLDSDLTYTIRFQNTGIGEAVNIHILDSLDANLNLSTMEILSYSHPLITEILPGNVIKFNFNDIYLVDSSVSQMGSQGYVVYRILPNDSVLENTVINNGSSIYFDFNPPIITNSVFNTLISGVPPCLLSVNEEHSTSTNLIYPNPNNGNFNFYSDKNGHIEIFDVYGRIVLSKRVNEGLNEISLPIVSAGIYILSFDGRRLKFVKE